MTQLSFEITPQIQRCLEDILFLDKEYLLGGKEGGDGREIVCLVEKYKVDEDTPRQRLNGRGFWKYLAEQNAILRFPPGKKTVDVKFSDIRKEELSKRGGVIAVGKNIKVPNEINYITSGQKWQQNLLKLVKQNYSKYELFQILDIKPIEELLKRIKSAENETEEDKDKKIQPITLPENTKWEYMTIRFIDNNDNVEVSVKGKNIGTFNFVQMGFEDGKTKRPNFQWGLLKYLTMQKGVLSWKDNSNVSLKEKNAFKQRVKKLKDTLKECFQIKESPFYTYTTERGYEIKINLIPSRSDQSETKTYEDEDKDGFSKEIREVFDESTPSVYEESKEYDDNY